MNKRIFYACSQLNLKPYGSGVFNSANAVHGVQSIGLNTNFNNDTVFELSQISIYENIENLPDVELTIEKVIDGYPLVYHMATPEADSATLVGRSRERCDALVSDYSDTLDATSGTPISEHACSGLFVSQLSYTMPVEGNFTESVTLVGNVKKARVSTFQTTGAFATNDDVPPGTGGVQRRENIIFGSGESILPTTVDGISGIADVQSGSGYNIATSGEYAAHIQNISVSTSLGRTPLNELGRKAPYYRAPDFPVEVTCEISVLSTKGDMVTALDDQDNLFDEMIYLKLSEGTILDLGRKNRLLSVSRSGGEAAQGGSNVTVTYNYRNYNDLTITHPEDPAGL